MNNTPTLDIDGQEYDAIQVQVYDRVAHRTCATYSTLTGTGTWMMWQGLNVDGVRYTKSLYGRRPGTDKFVRIAFVG